MKEKNVHRSSRLTVMRVGSPRWLPFLRIFILLNIGLQLQRKTYSKPLAVMGIAML